MGIDFAASAGPTLGVEWEFGLVDKTTRDLVNAAREVFDGFAATHGEDPHLHHELLRNTVEVTTGICTTTAEAMDQLAEHIDLVRPITDDLGVDLYSAGTHPFAEWSQQILTEGHRYEELIARTQWWGRQMLIWGVHVHVGLRNRDHVLPILTSLLNQYPHLQALSASSPVWAGAGHRLRQQPGDDVPAAADGGAAVPVPVLGRVRGLHPGPAHHRRDRAGRRDPLGRAPVAAAGHDRGPDLRRRLHDGRDGGPGRPHALPRRRPRAAAGGGRDAAVDAAVARAGEQVAQRPLRARRLDHPRRPVRRAAAPGRPR